MKNSMLKYIFVLFFQPFFIFNLSLLNPPLAHAHCPLCVAGAGAGLSLSRILGIDDSITGIWFAAFLGAMSLWFANTLNKRFIPMQSFVIYLATFLLTVLSFYKFGLVNEHNGLILNLPKLVFGVVFGGAIFYSTDLINQAIKKSKGKVLFPYQPIIFSLGAMLLLSFVVFYLINYVI